MGKKLLSVYFLGFILLLNSWSGFGQTCPSSVSISAEPGTTICAGTAVEFTANPSGGSSPTYKWFLNNNEISGETSKIYKPSSLSNGDKIKVIVNSSDSENCENKESIVTMTVNAVAPVSFNINSNKTSICTGDSVTFSTGPITNGGSSPSYQWRKNGNPISGATSSTFTTADLISTDKITLALTSSAQCADPVPAISNNEISITVNSLPTLTTNNGSVCAAGQTSIDLQTLVNGSGNNTFYLSEANAINKTGAINSVVSPTSQTTYYVRNESSTGCFITDDLLISIDALPTVDAGPDQSICPGESFDLSSIGSGTNRTFYTSLTNAENGTSPLSSSVVSPTGNTSYYVRSENAQGCYNTDSVIISINPLPTLTTNNASICAEGQTSIDLNSLVTTNGTATFYNSQANAENKSNPINATVSPSSETTYFVRSELPTGCFSTETIVISIDALPTLSVINGSVCASNQTDIDLSSLVTTNGTTISYHSSQAQADSNSSPIDAVVSPSSSTTYYVRSANAQGCYNTAAIQILIDALPTVDAGSDTEICIGESIDLNDIATGSGTLSYYTSQENAENGTSPLSSSNVTPTSTTTYYVRSESTAGCYSIDSIVISVDLDATLALTSSNNEQTICANSSISAITYSIGEGGTGANVTGLPAGVSGNFSNGNYTISGTPTVAGTYNYTITTTGCGTTSATGTINVDAPISSATPEFDNNDTSHNSTAICPVVSGLIYTIKPITGATSYIWTFPTGWNATTGTTNAGVVTTTNPTVTVNVTSLAATGTRNITVRGKNSCQNLTNQTSLPVTVDTYTYANAGPDQTVCKSASTITIQLNGEVGGAIGNHKDYDWSDNGANGTFNIQGNNKLTATYTIPASIQNNGGTITLNLTTVKPSKSSCLAATDEMVITVLKDATITTPSNKDQTVCINTAIESISFTIDEAGTGATVTGLPAGITGSFENDVFTIIGTPTESGTFNYTVSTTGTCTNQTSITGTIQVDPTTIANAGADLVACQSSNPSAITLVNSSVGGGATTGTWSITSGGGTLSSSAQTANPETITYTPAADFTGEVELTLTTNAPGECAATTDTRKIIIEPAPLVEAGEALTICQSSSPSPLTLSGATFGGGATTAAWSISSGGGTLSSSAQTANPQNVTYTPAVDFYGEVILTLKTDDPGTCEEVLDTKIITIDPVPIVDAGTSNPVCQSSSPQPITLSGASVSGGGSTAAWSITAGEGELSNKAQTENPENVTFTPAVNYIGTVVLTLTTNTPGTCTAVNATREIIVEPAPTVDAGNNIDICQTETPEAITLSGASIGGGASTAAWSISSGGGILSSTAQSNSPQNVTYTPDPGFTGEIELFLTTNAPGSCEAAVDNLIITIYPAATVEVREDLTICSSETVSIQADLGGGATSGTWSTSGSGTFSANSSAAIYTPSSNDLSAGSVTLTYTSNEPDGPCGAVSDSMLLTIKEEIIITTQPQNVGVCVTNPATLSVVAHGDDLTYQWYKGTNPGTPLANTTNISGVNSATLSFTQATLANHGTYYVVVGDGTTCTAVTSSEVTLNVNEEIIIETQPISQVVCVGEEITFSISASGAIDSYQWRKNGAEIPNEFGTTFTIPQTSMADNDVYDVKIYGIGGTCEAAFSAPFTLTVKENPVVDAGDNFEVCSSASSFNIATHPDFANASATNANTLEWTTNGDGTISNQSSLTDATYTPVAADLGKSLVFTLTGIVEVEGIKICAEAIDTKEITIISQPELTAFSYTDEAADTATEFCETDEVEKNPITIDGNNLDEGTGVFTVNKPELVINSSTGAFTPNGTPPGVYVITYTFNATSTTAVCTEVSRDFTVTIGANPVADFSYDSGVYCKDTRDTDFNTAPVISFVEEGHEDADSFSVDNAGLAIDASTGAIDLSNSTAGTYKITRTVDYTGSVEDGCQPVTAEVTITINDRPIPDFSYSETAYCSDPEVEETISPDMAPNADKGIFTYTSTTEGAILSLDEETGAVDIKSSDAGEFIITNTVDIDADGCNAVTDSFTITINNRSDATFEYLSSSYCITTEFAAVAEGFETGGVFSSSTLGSKLNSSTGAITWAYTDDIDGTHDITYTIEGKGICDDVEYTSSITIDPLPLGGELSFGDIGRIFVICENAEDGYAVPLNLTGHVGNISGWKYRTSSATSWSTVMADGEIYTGSTLSASLIEGLNINETTIFRVEIESGTCIPNVFSNTAIITVIPSEIKPTPVEVNPTVVCIGDPVTLTSGTGYESGSEVTGGAFDNSSITNHGWRITDKNGSTDFNFNSGANNTRPDKWLRINPQPIYIANINNPSTGTTTRFDSNIGNEGNKGFAIVSGNNPSTLETPVFTLDAMDQAILTFDQAYNLTAGDTIKVEISTNGGSSYNSVPLYVLGGPATSGNYHQFGSVDDPKHKIIIDLGNYMGQGNLRIRFNYMGKRDGAVWAVDNIALPDAPRDVEMEWSDYSDPVNFPNGEYIGSSTSEPWTPKQIGWNTFEVKTRLLFNSNGDACDVAENSESVDVFVFDKYTSTADASIGSCGNKVAQLSAEVRSDLQGAIETFPTIDNFTASWEVVEGPSEYNYQASHFSALDDPNATFEPGISGSYTLRWKLTWVNVEGVDPEESCPPIYVDVPVDFLDCIALDFDGDDDYVDLGKNYAETGYSFEAWVKPTVVQGTIISGPQFNISTPSGLSTTRWTHVAVAGGKLYLDGLESGSAPSGNGGERTLIGARWDDVEAKDHFHGWIEEVRIWNKTLTKEQIEFMMNQRLHNDANIGELIPMPAPGGLVYGDLAGYYRLISAVPDPANLLTFDTGLMPADGKTPDLATNKVPGILKNMETNQENTAPLPYFSGSNGDWDTAGTWARGTIWALPNSSGVNWNIVRTLHDVDSGRDITVLGLLSEENTLDFLGQNPTTWDGNSGGTGNALYITHYLLLNGVIDLNGESQLLQPPGSIIDSNSSGKLQRDQQGTANSYNYNYWSSPVSENGSNAAYTVAGVLRDGTDPASPGPIKFWQWTWSCRRRSK
jgi:large repetitive protein